MTGHVYRLSSSFELPLDELYDYLDDPDLNDEVDSIEVTRRNNKLLVEAVASDDSISKYTATARLKATIEEKRVYEDEQDEQQNYGWKGPQDEEEERESELIEFAAFKGGLGTVLQNTALRYPMFELLRDIASLTDHDLEGSLTAIVAEDDELKPIRLVDGEERPATIEVVEEGSAEAAGQTGGVSWGSR